MSILDEISEQEKIDAMRPCQETLPIGEKQFLESVVKDDKKNGTWYDTFVTGGLVVGIAIVAILMFFENNKYGVQTRTARQHINLAITTGKTCSSCHLGASFVNLFNHEAVKTNDNVVFYILDEVKVKRW